VYYPPNTLSEKAILSIAFLLFLMAHNNKRVMVMMIKLSQIIKYYIGHISYNNLSRKGRKNICKPTNAIAFIFLVLAPAFVVGGYGMNKLSPTIK
jgi:hypothetical protein